METKHELSGFFMPIVNLSATNPFIDGRQSNRALMIRQGLMRYLDEAGHAVLPELTLKGGRRADLIALSQNGEITIIEIKSSIEDFKSDNKWSDYLDHCDKFFFATLADVPTDIFPSDHGLMLADAYGAEVLRPSSSIKLAAPRRKTIQVRFARAAALRLARCADHAGIDPFELATASDD